jgi:glucans biosynthesis protein
VRKLNRSSRREVFAGAAVFGGLVAAGARPAAAAAGRFSHEVVARQAYALAARPYAAPDVSLPPKLANIDYGVYASLRFQPDRALWRAEGLPFQVQFFPRGYLYRPRIDIYEVAQGRARPVGYSSDLFANAGLDQSCFPPDLGFSGFRLHAPINSPDLFEEFAVFQGASYFRGVARGQVYGLSGRGLALGSGEANEEFPYFKSFWLERPDPGAKSMVVHALLDSPSVAGAYQFRIRPGSETVFDVEATLYPRRTLSNVGVAPMSSMFYLGGVDHYRRPDPRVAVHDSQGLEMWAGSGERFWRPVDNPSALDRDGFADRLPRGFGLMQRTRRPEDFRDSQQYERRPSLWVEPLPVPGGAAWSQGDVSLVEIPTTDANADNIAAFWRPGQPWAAGAAQRLRYRLHWGWDGPDEPRLARVHDTHRSGPQGLRFQIDFRPPEGARLDPATLGIDARTSAGVVRNAAVEFAPTPEVPGAARLSFDLDPGLASLADLRAHLTQAKSPASETWLYRWKL